jgi:hypothetical protein
MITGSGVVQQTRSPLQNSSPVGVAQFAEKNISILSVTLRVTIILGERHTFEAGAFCNGIGYAA